MNEMYVAYFEECNCFQKIFSMSFECRCGGPEVDGLTAVTRFSGVINLSIWGGTEVLGQHWVALEKFCSEERFTMRREAFMSWTLDNLVRQWASNYPHRRFFAQMDDLFCRLA